MILQVDFKSYSSAFPNGVPKTQSATTPEGLEADGAKVRGLIRSIVSALVETANYDLAQKGYSRFIEMSSFRLADPKTRERMDEKAHDEYEGSYVDLRDVERCCVDLRRPEHIAAFCSVLDWAKGEHVELPHGAVICIAENRFIKPTDSGYSSHKVNIVIPIPGEPGRHHIIELMTVHGEFEHIIANDKNNRLRMGSHDVYNVKRKLDGRVATGRFSPSMIKYYAHVSRITNEIHANARRACNFDEIDFKPFEELRQQETLEALDAAINDELSREL